MVMLRFLIKSALVLKDEIIRSELASPPNFVVVQARFGTKFTDVLDLASSIESASIRLAIHANLYMQ